MEDRIGEERIEEVRTPRGFAAMTPEQRREAASRGGKAAHAQGKAHRYTSEAAREAGKLGAAATLAAHGREHMQKIGRRGGESVASMPGHMAAMGSEGGRAVSADREHMARIGRLGGLAKGRRAAQ